MIRKIQCRTILQLRTRALYYKSMAGAFKGQCPHCIVFVIFLHHNAYPYLLQCSYTKIPCEIKFCFAEHRVLFDIITHLCVEPNIGKSVCAPNFIFPILMLTIHEYWLDSWWERLIYAKNIVMLVGIRIKFSKCVAYVNIASY